MLMDNLTLGCHQVFLRMSTGLVFVMLMPLAAWAQQVSPDGKRYVYYAEQEGNTDIYVVNLDGRKRQRITEHPWPDYNPQWSASGTHIYFYRTQPETKKADLYVMDTKGENLHALTETSHYTGDPSISHTNKNLAFNSNADGDYEVFRMVLPEGMPQQLTHNEANDYSADWSPDERQLVFVSNRSGSYEIYRMQADGSDQQRLTDSGADNYKPAWSPDGSWIAFFSNRTGNFDLYVMRVDGTDVRNLTRTPDWNEYTPSWLPDSQSLVFSTDQPGHEGLYRVSLEGGDPVWLTHLQGIP